MDWQPISSAPRDGTMFLAMGLPPLWVHPITIHWSELHGDWQHSDPAMDDLYAVSDSITHWTPFTLPLAATPNVENDRG